MNWGNALAAASSGRTAFTAIPRCSPPDLVRLWCGRPVRAFRCADAHLGLLGEQAAVRR